MTKSMFDSETEAYTREAQKDLCEVGELLSQAVDILEAKGYKLRDIEYALIADINITCVSRILSRQVNKRKKQ